MYMYLRQHLYSPRKHKTRARSYPKSEISLLLKIIDQNERWLILWGTWLYFSPAIERKLLSNSLACCGLCFGEQAKTKLIPRASKVKRGRRALENWFIDCILPWNWRNEKGNWGRSWRPHHYCWKEKGPFLKLSWSHLVPLNWLFYSMLSRLLMIISLFLHLWIQFSNEKL